MKDFKEAVLEAFEIAPLPNPPLELPDFLPFPLPLLNHWFGRRKIFAIDRQGFNMRLAEVCEIHLPDYVRRSIDPTESESEWLASNSDTIAERVLALQVRDWLAVALDENVPDTDRWYLGSSLLVGLALGGTEVARDDCYYLLEAIAYAVTPEIYHIRMLQAIIKSHGLQRCRQTIRFLLILRGNGRNDNSRHAIDEPESSARRFCQNGWRIFPFHYFSARH